MYKDTRAERLTGYILLELKKVILLLVWYQSSDLSTVNV